MWQPLHTRVDNSKPRFGSAKPNSRLGGAPFRESEPAGEVFVTFGRAVNRAQELLVHGSDLSADKHRNTAMGQDLYRYAP